MEGIRQYILTVICASVLIAIITAFLGEKKHLSGIMKLITGVFIIFTVIAPVISIEIRDFQDFYKDISEDALAVVRQGELMTQQSSQEIIKQQLEAYILDKASSMNLDVDIDLTLEEAAIAEPKQITIYGNVSPYSKKMLQTFLVDEIGIPEEMQLWR